MRAAYARMHALGWAHSVEVWDEEGLAGGLYGVELGGLFAAESKFHVRTDASKVALVALVERLRAEGGADRLLDVQWTTPAPARARGARHGAPRVSAAPGGGAGRAAGARAYAVTAAGSSIRRGSSVSRAITSRWICDVPS